MREHGVAHAAGELLPREPVVAQELLQSLDGLDPFPLVPAGDARVESHPRLPWPRPGPRLLGEHLSRAHERAALHPELPGGLVLELHESRSELLPESVRGIERLGTDELELDALRHGPVLPEEVVRTLHQEGLA